MNGKTRLYLFLGVVSCFVVALVLTWPALGNGAGIAATLSLLAGTVIGLRRVRENRDDPPGLHRFGRLDHALPKKWQRWMLGED